RPILGGRNLYRQGHGAGRIGRAAQIMAAQASRLGGLSVFGGNPMNQLPSLASLGRRIMIMGTTNAGKSTLGNAIGHKLGIPAVHADVLYHQPNTDWEPRPKAEFLALHAAAIQETEWVMDGNYSSTLPERLARATGVILLDDDMLRTRRYFWRTLIQKQRAGGLEGNQDSLKWSMLHWIWHTRNSAAKYRQMAIES